MKARIKFVVEIEYDLNPPNYPEELSLPSQMLDFDIANARKDPLNFIDAPSAVITISGVLM